MRTKMVIEGGTNREKKGEVYNEEDKGEGGGIEKEREKKERFWGEGEGNQRGPGGKCVGRVRIVDLHQSPVSVRRMLR